MKLLLRLLALLTLLAGGLLALGAWWLYQPLTLKNDLVEMTVEPGDTPRVVAQNWVRAGVDTSPTLLYEWFRWSGQATAIRAGGYAAEVGVTPKTLLEKMVNGEEQLYPLRLPEGQTFRQWRQLLVAAPGLTAKTAQMSDQDVMAALGFPSEAPEGRFFPDTYNYSKGSTDLAILRRAHQAMTTQLTRAWAARSSHSVLTTPEQALVLASIVEKETGAPADRSRVAGVFNNRLRIGMPLQTDPTVIYGLGEQFDGNLKKIHLQTDHPFNTYTRRGLPPTPIAMPGKEALMAAVQPAVTPDLYFVARGDGSSEFSATLEAHNRAVNRYQRQRTSSP